MQESELQNITHGEIAITKVDKIPKGKTESHSKYVAAHSETGHNHVIESSKGFTVTTTESGERYLLIKDVAKLYHQKTHDMHATRTLQPGKYKITEKTEYNPFTKTIQRVFD